MAINIDRSNMDQFYRYKMPRLLAKVKDASWMQSPFVPEKTFEKKSQGNVLQFLKCWSKINWY